MKKILLVMTALLALGGLSAEAQTLEFQYQGVTLDDGATVTIAAEENVFGELACETNPIDNPANGLMLKMGEGAFWKAKAELEIMHNTLDATAIQWCMGGECTMFGGKTLMEKTFTAAGNMQVQFDAANIRSKGYLMAKLTVTLLFETIEVYIQFTNGESAGIDSVRKTPDSQKVYSLNGTLLPDKAASMKDLPSGVYVVGGKKYIHHKQ